MIISAFLEWQFSSVAGAGFLILEELLERGFQIDFYGFKDYTYPQELLKYKNFHYIAVPRKSPFVRSFIQIIAQITNTITNTSFFRQIVTCPSK